MCWCTLYVLMYPVCADVPCMCWCTLYVLMYLICADVPYMCWCTLYVLMYPICADVPYMCWCTLYVLMYPICVDVFGKHEYIGIFYHFLTFRWCKWLKYFVMEHKDFLFSPYNWYHGWFALWKKNNPPQKNKQKKQNQQLQMCLLFFHMVAVIAYKFYSLEIVSKMLKENMFA